MSSTTPTTPIEPAGRLASLAEQQRTLEARRAAVEQELVGIDQASAEASRAAAESVPDLAARRGALAAAAADTDRERLAALAAGTDTTDLTRRAAQVHAELALLDQEIAQVRAWGAQAEAEAARERQAAEYERLIVALGDADRQVTEWLASAEPALADAVAEVEAAADRLIAAIAKAKPAADRAAALRQQAHNLAAQLGRAVPPGGVVDPLNVIGGRLIADLPRARLFFGAARGDRVAVAQALAENVRR